MDIDNQLGQLADNPQHAAAWSILPWFVNGSLSRQEHAATASHVAGCLVCRREVMALQTLAKAVHSRALEPQCEAALDRLHERLDQGDAAASHRIVPWAAAAVLVIVTALTSLIAINSGVVVNSAKNSRFITLGARTVAVDSGYTTTARIVFEQDITERQMRDLLLGADAELIDGPTPRGAYTIALPERANAGEVRAAVAKLRLSKSVIFVEPVVPIGPSRAD